MPLGGDILISGDDKSNARWFGRELSLPASSHFILPINKFIE